MPEKFDVDANLVSLPLATYALANGAMVDRGQILSNQAGPGLEQQLHNMEGEIQDDLVNAGLIDMGMDPNEPFEVVLHAEGVEEFEGAPQNAVNRFQQGTANRDIRNRIFGLRRTNPEAFARLGQALFKNGYATEVGNDWALRDDDEEAGAYAFSNDDLEALDEIISRHENQD